MSGRSACCWRAGRRASSTSAPATATRCARCSTPPRRWPAGRCRTRSPRAGPATRRRWSPIPRAAFALLGQDLTARSSLARIVETAWAWHAAGSRATARAVTEGRASPMKDAENHQDGSPVAPAHPRHRRRRLPRLPSLRPAGRGGPRGALRRQLLHRAAGQHRASARRPNFELMRHDVTFPLYVEVDEIYNLACPASPIHYQHDPGADDQDLRARRDQHARPRQADAGEDPPGLDLARSTATRACIRRPRTTGATSTRSGRASCYDEGKRCAETLFFDYHRQHRLRIKVARIFNTYGPRMHPNDGRVVSNFIVQALQGRADHPLRRRPADPQLLLRRRPDRRVPAR